MHSFIQRLPCLLNASHVPGTIQRAEDLAINQIVVSGEDDEAEKL